jgi:cytidylate kinase
MIISLSGNQGSGKSTIAERLAKKLGWPRYYIGGLRRAAAERRGLSLAEYNKLGESDPQTDLEVDNYQKKLGETEDNFIIEGRTSWYMIPQSLKIYINVEDEVGAQRIFNDIKQNNRQSEKELRTYEDVLAGIKARRASDDKRYRQYFNINVHDLSHYDFVLDTTNLSPDEAFDQVDRFIQSKMS